MLFFFCINKANAQLSVSIAPGLMNYGGDLQGLFYTFKEADLSLSAGMAYQINKISLRAGLTYGKVKGSDAANGLYETRNLSFATNISEINFALQYDFFKMDDFKKFTPYIFGGVGFFHFNPYTFYQSRKVYLQPLSTEGEGLSIYPGTTKYSLSQAEIPLGIGFKYKLSDRIQVGLEFCSRFLFTDYLDDVSKTYPDENVLVKERGQLAADVSFRGDEVNPALPFPAGQKRGNPGQNDNFYTSSLVFTYIFPERSFLTGGKHSKELHSVNCPPAKQ